MCMTCGTHSFCKSYNSIYVNQLGNYIPNSTYRTNKENCHHYKMIDLFIPLLNSAKRCCIKEYSIENRPLSNDEKSIKSILLTNNITEKKLLLFPLFTIFATYTSTTE